MKIRKTSTHIFATCQLRTWHALMSFQPHNNDLWFSKQTSCHFTSEETEAQRREAAPAILAWVRSNYGSQTWTWLQLPHTHTHPHQFRQVTDLHGRLVRSSRAPEWICDPRTRCSCRLLTAPGLRTAGRGTGPRLSTPNLGTNPLWLPEASCSQTSAALSGCALKG